MLLLKLSPARPFLMSMSISIGSSLAQTSALRLKTAIAATRPDPNVTPSVDGAPSNAAPAAPASPAQGSSSERPSRATSSDGPRVEVDRRTEDSRSVRVTVISYSDGSSESVTQMKADELVAGIAAHLAKQADSATAPSRMPASLNDKGMIVDKQA